jgi:hypothetical protein
MTRPRQAALVIIGSLLLASCGSSATSPGSAPAVPGGSSTIAVRQGDIDVVLALSGNVLARPSFAITATAAGRIHLSAAPKEPSASPTVIAQISGTAGTTTLSLPAYSGFQGWLVREGDTVTAGLPVVSAYYSGFAVEAAIPSADLYRFYGSVGAMQAQISHGPGPFACPQLGSVGGAVGAPDVETSTETAAPDATAAVGPVAQGPSGADGSGPIVLLCAAPRDLTLFAGMPAILAVPTAQAHGVMVLPVEAVAGSSQRGRVTLMKRDGTKEARDIELGITDGTLIEIKSGLNVGDVVAIPGPFLAPGLNP